VLGLVVINTGAPMFEDTLQFVRQMPSVTALFTHLQSCAIFSWI